MTALKHALMRALSVAKREDVLDADEVVLLQRHIDSLERMGDTLGMIAAHLECAATQVQDLALAHGGE